MGTLATPAKKPAHADQHAGRGRRRELRRDPLYEIRKDRPRDASDHQRRGEDTARPSGRDGEGGGENLGRQEKHQDLERQLVVEGELQPTVAAAQDLRHRQGEDREEEPTDRRFGPVGNRHAGKDIVAHPVEDLDINDTDDRHHHTPAQGRQRARAVGQSGYRRCRRWSSQPGERSNHHIRHDRGHDGRA